MRHAILSAGLLLALSLHPALAGGDPAAGEKVFARCKACHSVDASAGNKIGPNLHGVVGRTAGTKEDFKYSSAMKKAGEDGLVWSEDTLDTYLTNPQGLVKGNRMPFPGLKKADERANVIAYLKAHSGS